MLLLLLLLLLLIAALGALRCDGLVFTHALLLLLVAALLPPLCNSTRYAPAVAHCTCSRICAQHRALRLGINPIGQDDSLSLIHTRVRSLPSLKRTICISDFTLDWESY